MIPYLLRVRFVRIFLYYSIYFVIFHRVKRKVIKRRRVHPVPRDWNNQWRSVTLSLREYHVMKRVRPLVLTCLIRSVLRWTNAPIQFTPPLFNNLTLLFFKNNSTFPLIKSLQYKTNKKQYNFKRAHPSVTTRPPNDPPSPSYILLHLRVQRDQF